MSKGIQVAIDGKNLRGGKKAIAFDSGSDYLKLDVNHAPPSFDFKKYTFGPGQPTTLLAGTSATTELFNIPHNLGYQPASLVYFYNYDGANYIYNPVNSYQLGRMDLTSTGFVQQTLWYTCDAFVLHVYYSRANTDASDHALTDLSNRNFGFKYLIFNNEIS